MNIPITINNNKYNIKIEIGETKNITSLCISVDKLYDLLGCSSFDELNDLLEDNEKIHKLLIEQINNIYMNNLKFVKRKLDNIDDEEYKNKVIKELYEIVKKSYKDMNINKNILLYLAKLLNSTIKNRLSLCKLSRPNNDLTQKIDYEIMKLLFNNGICDMNNENDLLDIMYLHCNSNIEHVKKREIINFKVKILKKFNVEILIKFIECNGLPYYLIKGLYKKIKDRLNFSEIKVYKELYLSGKNQCKIELLNMLCLDKRSNIALKVLEDEDKCMSTEGKNKKALYESRYALDKALENNMVNVVFKIARMKQKYEKKTVYTFKDAIKNGDLENAKWLKENGCKWYDDIFSEAAYSGNLEIMKWLKENGCYWSESTFANAALNGNLVNMKWLKENGCPWNYETFNIAAKNGNLENMKWLKENGCEIGNSSLGTFYNAAKNGNLENMKWLLMNGCVPCVISISIVAENGNLEIMKWLNENRCEFKHSMIFSGAAKNGNLKNMMWLKENGCEWNTNTFREAALNGNLENMKWLKENGCPWDSCTFHYAAKKGDFKNMLWLFENGCKWDNNMLYSHLRWDEYAFEEAVKKGNLEIMKWLLKNGCEWHENIFSLAVENGNLENMNWLLKNGFKLNQLAFTEAEYCKNIEVVKWLLKNGCPISDYTRKSINRVYNLNI